MAIRALALVPTLGLAVLGVVGCSSGVTGTPTPTADPSASTTTQQSSSATTTPSVSASIDPCKLLTAQEATQLNLVPDGRKDIGVDQGYSRGCRWHEVGQYTVDFAVYDHVGLDTIGGNGQPVTNHPVGSHDGRQSFGPTGSCGISLAISPSSMVDVSASVGTEVQNCQVASQYATLVEPRLPAEQK
jgi:hypothetical protein